MAGLLGRHGYAVTSDGDLLRTAKALATSTHHHRSLGMSRVTVADRR